jgi:hypothetical protein
MGNSNIKPYHSYNISLDTAISSMMSYLKCEYNIDIQTEYIPIQNIPKEYIPTQDIQIGDIQIENIQTENIQKKNINNEYYYFVIYDNKKIYLNWSSIIINNTKYWKCWFNGL